MTLSEQEVQKKLSAIGPHKPFTITFMKKNGETRTIHGYMEVPKEAPRSKTSVPVCEIESGLWKSFRLDSVLEIAYVE